MCVIIWMVEKGLSYMPGQSAHYTRIRVYHITRAKGGELCTLLRSVYALAISYIPTDGLTSLC